MMPPGYEDSPAGCRCAVIDNPHLVESFFGARVDAFTSALFDGVIVRRGLQGQVEVVPARIPREG